MWVKTTYCCRLFLPLIIRKSIYNLVLVQTHTSTQASTCIRLQPSLILQLLLEGSYNPLALVLADMFTSTQALTYKRLRPSFFLQGPRFINFQTRYSQYTTIHMKASFHLIFILDPLSTLKIKINHHCTTTIKYICINQSLKLNHKSLNHPQLNH